MTRLVNRGLEGIEGVRPAIGGSLVEFALDLLGALAPPERPLRPRAERLGLARERRSLRDGRSQGDGRGAALHPVDDGPDGVVRPASRLRLADAAVPGTGDEEEPVPVAERVDAIAVAQTGIHDGADGVVVVDRASGRNTRLGLAVVVQHLAAVGLTRGRSRRARWSAGGRRRGRVRAPSTPPLNESRLSGSSSEQRKAAHELAAHRRDVQAPRRRRVVPRRRRVREVRPRAAPTPSRSAPAGSWSRSPRLLAPAHVGIRRSYHGAAVGQGLPKP